MPLPKKYRILALDGGQRGPLMVRILQRLHQAVPGFLDSVDVFTGNSAGSMISAVLLTRPNFGEGLEAAAEFWMPQNFPAPPFIDKLLALTGRFPLQQNDHLLGHLRCFIGDSRLSDLKKKFIVPSFSLDNGVEDPMYHNWSPRLFHNLNPDEPGADDLLVDIVMRSSSAPVVSPVYQGHIDGAIFANNPSLCAITLVMDVFDAKLEDIEVLSIGMGQNPIFLRTSTNNLGYADWLFDSGHPLALLNAVAESNLKAVNYQCGRLLRDSYFRLDPRLPRAFHSSKQSRPQDLLRELENIAHGTDVVGAANWLLAHGWAKSQAKTVGAGNDAHGATKRRKASSGESSSLRKPRQPKKARN